MTPAAAYRPDTARGAFEALVLKWEDVSFADFDAPKRPYPAPAWSRMETASCAEGRTDWK